MKKLTLNKAWDKCLEEWDFVISVLESDEFSLGVGEMKDLWIYSQKETESWPANSCYFCEYAEQHGLKENGACPQRPGGCPECPGTKVDPNFCCEGDICWYVEPQKFYKLLKKLNKKRIKQSK